MTRRINRLVATAVLLLAASFQGIAQDSDEPSEFTTDYKLGFDVYYGTPMFFQWTTALAINSDLSENYSKRTVRNEGPFGVRLEYRVDPDFGIGIDIGYNGLTASATREVTTFDPITNQEVTQKYTDEFKSSKIGAVITFNLRLYEKENFEASGVVGIGYGRRTFSFNSDDPNYDEDAADAAQIGANLLRSAIPPVSFRFGIITRYYFTPNVGLNLGLGIGQGGLINGGLSFRF